VNKQICVRRTSKNEAKPTIEPSQFSRDVYTRADSESERDAAAKLGDALSPTIPNLHQNISGKESGIGVTH
jgi:hypothetical protein